MLSSYLTGTYDLRNDDNTLLHVINPTAKHLKVIVSFFDDNSTPITCLCESLKPNDLFEMDVQNLPSLVTSGTVKRVGLDHLWTRL